MKKLFTTAFLFFIYLSVSNAQSISFDKMNKSLGIGPKNIEAFLTANRYEYVANTDGILIYKYSDEEHGAPESGTFFLSYSTKNGKVEIIRYTTISKDEYFKWKAYLKINGYKAGKVDNQPDSKDEAFSTKSFGAMLSIAQQENNDNPSQKVNTYTLTVLKVN